MALQYRMNRFDVETIEGLSTDTKPPYPKEGATFRELDTDRKWIYTEREGWILIGGGGGEGVVLHGINQGWVNNYYNAKDNIHTSLELYPGMWTTPTSDYVVELAEDGRIVVNGTEISRVMALRNQVICVGLDHGFNVLLGWGLSADSRPYFSEYWSGYVWYAPARLEIKGFRMTIESTALDSDPRFELDLDLPYSVQLGYGDQDPLDRFVLSLPFHDSNAIRGADVASIGGDQYCVIACLQRSVDRSSAGRYSDEYIAIADGDRTLTVLAERGIPLVDVSFEDGYQEDTSIVHVQFVSGVTSDDYDVYVMHPAFVRPSAPVEMPWKGKGTKGDVPADMWVYSVADGVATVTGISQEWDRPEGFSAVVPDYDPDGHPVRGIGDGAFYGEDRMGSFSGNVLTVGNGAFYGCSSLVSVSLPNVTDLGVPRYTDSGSKMIFAQCTSLESVDLPSVTRVGNGTFNNCTSLREIILPSATEIGVGAFLSCSALETVVIPASAVIWYDAFRACDAVTYVQFGPLTTVYYDSFGSWVFYSNNSVLSITARNLANQRFRGTASRLELISDV